MARNMQNESTMNANGPADINHDEETLAANAEAGKNPFLGKKPPPADIAILRTETAARTVTDRLRAAHEALDRAGLDTEAKRLRFGLGGVDMLTDVGLAKDAAKSLRNRLTGSVPGTPDGNRYAAALTALDALGRLWAVL